MSASLVWRPDIQRLRGFAILVVVVYHTKLAIPGGFAGVDAFFVISGFVIASSLKREVIAAHTVSVRSFYVRRVRRLVPNYLLLISVSLIFSHLLFEPYFEIPQIKWTAISSLFMSANIYFLLTDSYDALAGNPLRQLWSLGIEEHFYLVLPWLYIVSIRRFRDCETWEFRFRRVAKSLLFISISLLILVVYTADAGLFGIDRSTLLRTKFFASPLRFWEILAGVIVAHSTIPQVTKRLIMLVRASAYGVLLLCFLLLENPDTFPNMWAVVVIASTCLLVAFPPASSVRIDILTRIFEVLGNVSYAWYLWHWPVFVILHRELGISLSVAVLGIGISLILAFITTKWVEEPFHRRRVPIIRMAPLILLGLSTVVGSVWLGRSAYFYGLFPRAEAKTANLASVNGCGWSNEGWTEECVFGIKQRGGVRLALLGDSNARSASDGLVAAADANSWSITLGVRSGCPAIFAETQVDTECARLNSERLAFLRDTRPDVVVLVNHWSNYRRSGEFADPEAWTRAMGGTINSISDLGIPVLIQYQIPYCQTSNSLLRSMLVDRGWRNAYLCQSKPDIERYIDHVADGLEATCNNNKWAQCQTLDIVDSLCSSRNTCQAFVGRTNYFSDPTHISPSASRLTSNQYAEAIRAILKLD